MAVELFEVDASILRFTSSDVEHRSRDVARSDLSLRPNDIFRCFRFTYKGKAVDVKQVGRDLGVRYVLEGSVRKAGNRVRVTGQLIDAASGEHIWADRFDRDLTDIFAVQDELTQEIISALRIKLTPEQKNRLGRRNTIEEEAYDLFLRAREHTWHATRNGSIEARDLLERAVTINPDFAAAHAVIAGTYANDYANGWAAIPEQSLRTALEVAERAVQLDEEEPQAQEVLAIALFFHRDLDRALAEARRCLELAPSSAGGHVCIARILTCSGDPVSAIKMIDASMRLDPLYGGLALHFLAEARVSLGSSTKPSQPSHSALSATQIQKRPMLCLHRATVSSVGLPTLGQPGRR